MRALLAWLDERTGAVGFVRDLLYHAVPGGAGWRRVWGTLVLFALLAEFITGLALWLFYAPGVGSSWESVRYVQEEVAGGWLVRGVHHWVAQFLVVLLALHLLQIVLGGLYRAPRELWFWVTALLSSMVLAASFTGYILPWDRRGFMAAQVSSGLMSNVPVVGPWLRELFLGGTQAGQFTLQRVMTLHVGVLPGVIAALIVVQTLLWRRALRLEEKASAHAALPKAEAENNGVSAEAEAALAKAVVASQSETSGRVPWYPGQAWRDAAACLAFFALVAVAAWLGRATSLQAPADASLADASARPEWYFLFLFKLLHLEIFGGARQIIPAMVLPGLVFGALLLMPFVARWRWGHRLNAVAFMAGLAGYAALTAYAWLEDKRNPAQQAALAQAGAEAARALELARKSGGLPPEGMAALLADDAVTQGPRLFARKCASCHAYDGHNGLGQPLATPPSAADLAGFGSREWLQGFLDPAQHSTEKFWGGTAFVDPPEGKKPSKMTAYVMEDVAAYGAEEKQQLEKVVLALSAEARLPSQAEADARDAAVIEEGRALLGSDGLACADCHKWREETEGKPDLDGWASRDWTIDFVSDPAHERFYGARNDRMPSYGPKGELSPRQIEMIVEWLRGEAQ